MCWRIVEVATVVQGEGRTMEADHTTVGLQAIALAFVLMVAITGGIVFVLFGPSSVSYGYTSRRNLGLAAFVELSVSQGRDQTPCFHGEKIDNWAERREFRRRRGNPVQVVIAVDDAAGVATPGMVIDRSRGGLCLAVAQPPAVGSYLLVRPANSPDSQAWVRVQVRHCRHRGGRWLIGCKFEQRLSRTELIPFG
jgi:hypothetical protein